MDDIVVYVKVINTNSDIEDDIEAEDGVLLDDNDDALVSVLTYEE